MINLTNLQEVPGRIIPEGLNTISVSEKYAPFATEYQLGEDIYKFTHSTGPEFDPATKWIYKCGDKTLQVCNDSEITKAAGYSYLMAKVYRTEFDLINKISAGGIMIFPDACDFGMPIKTGGDFWKSINQMVKKYAIPGTVKHEKYSTGKSCRAEIQFPGGPAFHIEYTSCNTGRCAAFDGYVWITKK